MSTVNGGQGNIITNGLVLNLDTANPRSYPPPYNGTTWTDLSGNGNNGTLTNGPTFNSGNGGSIVFDGTNDTVSIPHSANFSLNTTTQRTMQLWVRFNTLPTSTNRMIFFGKLSADFVFDGWWGGVNSSGNVVIATNGTGISKTSVSTLTVNINTWYLFTFISQITSTANTTKVYVNETEYISTFHGSDGYSESNNLTLGYLTPPLTGLSLISYLDGRIGSSYLYTKGLSTLEISQNFNATRARFGI